MDSAVFSSMNNRVGQMAKLYFLGVAEIHTPIDGTEQECRPTIVDTWPQR